MFNSYWKVFYAKRIDYPVGDGRQASAFCKAHPDSNPRTAPVAARLIDLSDRADKLLEQHGSGAAVAATAVVDEAMLRRAVMVDLQALMTIARQAAHRYPDISVHRGVSLSRCGEADFIATARVALASATSLLETMAPFGLSEELLASITQGLDTYKAAVDRKRDALGSRVGAQADLGSVAHEIMGVVASLDAMHAIRFRNSPEPMATWRSARNVAWPSNGTAEEVSPTAPAALVESSKAA